MYGVLEALDEASEARVGLHFLLDALDGVYDGGVVLAAEARTDALQADGGTFAHEEHGDLPCLGNFLGAAAGFGELGFGNFVMLRHGMENCVQTNAAAQSGCNFGDDLLGDAHVDVVVHEARLQGKLDDGAFEATHVTCNVLGEEVDDFVADFEVAFFSLLLENGFARLDVGRLDVHGEAPGETAHEAVGKVLDFDSRGIGGEHNLLAGLVQRVEDKEEFVLRFVLAGPVLDVVDEQNIHLVTVEVAHFGHAVFLEALHVLLREVLAGEVAHALVRIVLEDVVADGLQQVRLAEAGRTVDEQRVVLRAVRVPGYGEGRVERELRLVAGDEVLEAETAGKRYAGLREILENVFARVDHGLRYGFLGKKIKFDGGVVVGGFAPAETDKVLVCGVNFGIQSERDGYCCMAGRLVDQLGLCEICFVHGIRKHPAKIIKASFPFDLHKQIFLVRKTRMRIYQHPG